MKIISKEDFQASGTASTTGTTGTASTTGTTGTASTTGTTGTTGTAGTTGTTVATDPNPYNFPPDVFRRMKKKHKKMKKMNILMTIKFHIFLWLIIQKVVLMIMIY